jgi:hypothetical protein
LNIENWLLVIWVTSAEDGPVCAPKLRLVFDTAAIHSGKGNARMRHYRGAPALPFSKSPLDSVT